MCQKTWLQAKESHYAAFPPLKRENITCVTCNNAYKTLEDCYHTTTTSVQCALTRNMSRKASSQLSMT